MIHAQIKDERAVPLWAALGAPLLGVPLMVALLAVLAPAPSAPAAEVEVTPIERVEIQPADQSIEVEIDTGTASLLRG